MKYVVSQQVTDMVLGTGCGHLAVVHWSSSVVSSLHLHAVGHLQCHPSLPHSPLCYLWPGKPTQLLSDRLQ